MRLWKESPTKGVVMFRELRFPKPLRPRPPYLKSACNRIGVRIPKIIIESSDTTVVKYTYDGVDLLFEKDHNYAVQIRYLLLRVTVPLRGIGRLVVTAAYDIPSWERTWYFPFFGNMRQTYTWTEEIRK
jgi:hypothetical protein